MPFLRGQKKQLRKSINTGIYNLNNIEKEKIDDPVHYQENIWNCTIQRIDQEVKLLQSNAKQPADFADQIGLTIIGNDMQDNLDFEIKQIAALMNLWVGIGKGNVDAKAGIKAITSAAESFSTTALREFMRSYLKKTRSNGGFLIHLGYERLGDIFGDTLKYRMPKQKTQLVRFYNTDIPKIDFDLIKEFKEDFQIEDGIPHLDNTVFLPGDEAEADLEELEIKDIYPYINRKGQPSSSVFALCSAN